MINQTLKADTFDETWPIIPWVFAPTAALNIIKPELKKLFPTARALDLENILPWLYCYDRKLNADGERKQDHPAPSGSLI